MYLLMENAKYGQIQDTVVGNQSKGEIATHNAKVFDIAKAKGAIIWPKDAEKVSELELAAKWVFHQVARGMQYLHDELRIVHRDLKHDNILLGQKSPDPWNEDERQPTIKVCDFTTAQLIKGQNPDEFKVDSHAGTKAFNAPEVFTAQEYLAKPLDVWSFGIALFVYLCGELPFEHQVDDTQFEENVKTTNY